MDEVDRIFRCINGLPGIGSAVIACLYTGADLPPYCAPMPRLPNPPAGMIVDEGFPLVVAHMLTSNPALHDGAIMIGRRESGLAYRVEGWSYRLFPPQGACDAEPNRGSAFNSSLAMSSVETVDRVYLISKGGVFRFKKSTAEEVWP
jgi:hypothetical protein